MSLKNQQGTIPSGPNGVRDADVDVVPDERALMDELRETWGIAPGAPIVVVGRLSPKQLYDGRTVYFLDGLEDPTTGVGLLYPNQESDAARAFVHLPDVRNLDLSGQLWAVAELQLSSVDERHRQKNPYACRVRRGTLRPLRDIPAAWNVTVTGRDAVRRISEAAYDAIHAQQREVFERSAAELADLEEQRSAVNRPGFRGGSFP